MLEKATFSEILIHIEISFLLLFVLFSFKSVRENFKYLIFCVQHVALNMVSSRYIHLDASGRISLNNIPSFSHTH